jgi:hypothetical protein
MRLVKILLALLIVCPLGACYIQAETEDDDWDPADLELEIDD